MKKRLIPVLLPLILILSCSIESTQIKDDNLKQISTYVSEKDAVDALQAVLDIIDGSTKSHNRTVSSVEKLTVSDFKSLTKSEDSNTFDNLVYIVNFTEGGAAILGADTRIEPVIYISDSDNLSASDLLFPVDTSVGITSLEQLYCAEDDEYEIGNIRPLQIGILVNDYLDYTINNASSDSDSCTTQYMLCEGAYGPYMHTLWTQNSPFNDKCPTVKNGNHRPAGCTTIALAQILTANKDVPLSKLGVTNSTWDDLDRMYMYANPVDDHGKITYSGEFKKYLNRVRGDVATMTKNIADGIGVKYNYLGSGGTFATPAKVKKYMSKLGYNATKINHFSLDDIVLMLELGKPVFIAALASNTIKDGGHAWVIDGCATAVMENRVTGEKRTQFLLHCNMGWSGHSNGYYIPKLFNTSKPYLIDDPAMPTESFNAGWWYRIIKY